MKIRNTLNPSRTVFIVTTMSIIFALVSQSYANSIWRASVAFNTFSLVYLFCLGMCFCVPAYLISAKSGKLQKLGKIQATDLYKLCDFFIVLTLIGYVIWGVVSLRRGLNSSVLLSAVSLQAQGVTNAKAYLTTVSGFTTFTQFGPFAAAIVGCIRQGSGKWRFRFLALLVPAIIRGFLNAERLAIIEVLISFLVAQWFFSARPFQKLSKIAFLVIFPVIFIALEFTRSWTNYYSQHVSGGFFGFALSRLFAYYSTSLNNGFILIQHLKHGPTLPFYSLNFVFIFPFLKSVFHSSQILGYNPFDGLYSVLAIYGNPEFNNPNGFLSLVLDYGWYLAPLFAMVLGCLAGIVYKKARQKDVPSICFYSAMFIGLPETARYLYWTSGRAFPIVLAYFIFKKYYKETKQFTDV